VPCRLVSRLVSSRLGLQVCNHPDLFQHRSPSSSFVFTSGDSPTLFALHSHPHSLGRAYSLEKVGLNSDLRAPPSPVLLSSNLGIINTPHSAAITLSLSHRPNTNTISNKTAATEAVAVAVAGGVLSSSAVSPLPYVTSLLS